MKRHSFWTGVIPLLIAALLLQGCATEALWAEKYYQPAKPANLQLAVQPEKQMLLVQYDERFEEARKIERRAYWLDLNDPHASAERPLFLKEVDQTNLQPVPILPGMTTTNGTPTIGYSARQLAKGFELWRDGAPVAEFALPAYYATARADFKHVALTPLALLADGVILIVAVAGVGGAIVLMSYAYSGASGSL